MTTARRKWLIAGAGFALVASAVVVWLWPRGPEGVAVGTLEAPAEYGEAFSVVSDGGDVRTGTVLGVTEYPSSSEGTRCFMVVGVVGLTRGAVEPGEFGGFNVALKMPSGMATLGTENCAGADAYDSEVKWLESYGFSGSDGDDPGHYGLFLWNFSVEGPENPIDVVVSSTHIQKSTDVATSMSIYGFRVTRTLDDAGVAQ